MQYSLKGVFNFITIKDIGHIYLCAFVFPFAMIAKIFIRDFWLVCEERKEARDNGYYFFKWTRENKPKQKIAYAIDKKSPDYSKVKGLGKVIPYGGFSHWFWYIVADKNISSQKGGKPNPATCYLFEVVLKLRKNNRVFLQHGITVNKGEWIFYENTYFWRFITAGEEEHAYILKHFHYPKERVKLLGFPRFDGLHGVEADERILLVMPTWRNWLGRESRETKKVSFEKTEYFKKWNGFLQSEKLKALLKKYDKKLLFYPHRHMQKFLHYFKAEDENIRIVDWKSADIGEVLKKASLLITDYSSVFFDFSYMRKSVLFYQFDEKRFREKQYKAGYFNYRNSPLGVWCEREETLLKNLEESLKNGLPKKSVEQIKSFFPYYDRENCARVYEEIAKG